MNKLFYGWVVVAALFIVSSTLVGIRFSFGVFFKSIESEFALTRTTTSAIFSLFMLFAGMFTLIGGWALDRYGPRKVTFIMALFTGLSLLLTSLTNALWQLFITYSFFLAIGISTFFPVQVSIISRWFTKNRAFALGIAGSGGGFGLMVMAPLATYLITSFNWRTAYLVIGVLAWLITLPVSRLLIKDPRDIGLTPDGSKIDAIANSLEEVKQKEEIARVTELSLSQILKTRNFRLFMAIWILLASSSIMITTHLVPHITDLGITEVEAATVITVYGGAVITGRLVVGIISDRIGRKVTALICSLLQTVAVIWLIFAQELWMFYLFALIFGFAFGGTSPALGSLVADLFGLSRIGAIMGTLEAGFSFGAAAGPLIGGLIYDLNQSYFWSFVLGSAILATIALLTSLIRVDNVSKVGRGVVFKLIEYKK